MWLFKVSFSHTDRRRPQRLFLCSHQLLPCLSVLPRCNPRQSVSPISIQPGPQVVLDAKNLARSTPLDSLPRSSLAYRFCRGVIRGSSSRPSRFNRVLQSSWTPKTLYGPHFWTPSPRLPLSSRQSPFSLTLKSSSASRTLHGPGTSRPPRCIFLPLSPGDEPFFRGVICGTSSFTHFTSVPLLALLDPSLCPPPLVSGR